jgi:hypothetical protein
MTLSENGSSHSVQAAELPAEIFKAYDIRGIVETTLTPGIVERALPRAACGRRGT